MKRAKKDLLQYRKLVWFTSPTLKQIQEFDKQLKLELTPPPLQISWGTYRKESTQTNVKK